MKEKNDTSVVIEEGIGIVLIVVFLLIYGSILSVNSQVIKYHAHLVSSRAQPELWINCSQLLANLCKLSHVVVSDCSFQSLAYFRLSSTNPIMRIMYDRE